MSYTSNQKYLFVFLLALIMPLSMTLFFLLHNSVWCRESSFLTEDNCGNNWNARGYDVILCILSNIDNSSVVGCVANILLAEVSFYIARSCDILLRF